MENESTSVVDIDDNIRLVGTAHISRSSADLVKEQIADFEPDIVAVELDLDRLQALQNPVTIFLQKLVATALLSVFV